MPINFPTGFDNFPNPDPTTPTNSPGQLSHAEQHANANDAIEALEQYVGVTGSSDVNSLTYKIDNFSGGGGSLRVEDEGSTIVATATGINFAGAGVTVTNAGSNEALVTISGGGSLTDGDKGDVIVSGSGSVWTLDPNAKNVAIPADKTADYTLVLGDAHSSIGVNSATAKNVTVPLNSSVAYSIGTIIEIRQVGVGQVTIVPTGGVTLRTTASTLTTKEQYSAVSILKTGTDTWFVQGELEDTGGGVGITDGDKGDIVVSSSGTVWSIDAGVIVNADINSSAGIDLSKLATQAANSIVANGTGSTAVPTAVTFAANTFPGRSSTGNLVAKTITDFGFSLLDDANASTARTTLGAIDGIRVEDEGTSTVAVATALNFAGAGVTVTDAGSGEALVTISGGGGGVSDGDKGDITVTASGGTWTIDSGVVTYAKIQNVSATDRILGRDTAGAGVIEELTGAQVLSITGAAPLASPTFTGTPAAPTAGVGTSTTQLATTAFVQGEKNIVIPADKTADYTLVLTDAHTSIGVDSATAKNVTVPLNSSVAYPIGTVIEVRQVGAGQVTIVATGGVTLRSAGGALKTRVQYSAASLLKVATDIWSVQGDITT